MDFGGAASPVARRDEIEPLSGDRSRLHVNVSRAFTRKLEAARRGLGHSVPHANIEQALEAALDLLLEKQARARGLVKRPRAIVAPGVPARAFGAEPGRSQIPTSQSPELSPRPGEPIQVPEIARVPDVPSRSSAFDLAVEGATWSTGSDGLGTAPLHRRTGPREAIPAAVRRAVWERDGGRCVWPLDGGGCCGSTHRLELDHIHPWGRDGDHAEANLRVVCRAHNTLAARREFGARCVERYRQGRRA